LTAIANLVAEKDRCIFKLNRLSNFNVEFAHAIAFEARPGNRRLGSFRFNTGLGGMRAALAVSAAPRNLRRENVMQDR
jgi:hypothetical protein